MSNRHDRHTPGYWDTTRSAKTGEQWEICEAGKWEPIATVVDGPHAAGNAQLISSAPKMLEALRRLTHPVAIDEDVDFALAAIAEATGQDIENSNRPPRLEG